MTATTATDYYALLGVAPDATTAQIKSAYRKLAKQYHPDVNDSPDAAERFREITEAYDTLTDPDRRRRYDRLHGTRTGTSGTSGTSSGNASSGHRARTHNGSANGNGSQVASKILKVLEDIWLEIRRWNPEIPPVVIIIASGTDGKHPRWGHHAPDRWNVAGEQFTEIMISGEGLRRSARDVLATLLHEAAHALAHARGIKDTSRQGRYHNKHFKNCAEEVGLTVEHDDTHRLVRHHHHPRHRAGLRLPAPGPHRGHDAMAARRNHHRTQGPAQHQPDRGHLPLRALHPRGRLHPGRGTHHLPGLRPGLPGQEPR